MRQLLTVVLTWGLLVASAEATSKESTEEIANINTRQEQMQSNVMLTAKKPRLRFKARSGSGVPKTCGGSDMDEKQIQEAQQKRLDAQQQAKSSDE